MVYQDPISSEQMWTLIAVPLGMISLGLNALEYKITSQFLDTIAINNGKDKAKEMANKVVKQMDSRGWFENNVNHFGMRIAYEKFLYKNSVEDKLKEHL